MKKLSDNIGKLYCFRFVLVKLPRYRPVAKKDNMPDELFWKTPDDFEKEVNWLYTRTETFGTKDTDSDIAYELNENTTSNGTLIAPNTDALWDSTFIDLRQSNMIIEKSQTYEGDPSEIEAVCG